MTLKTDWADNIGDEVDAAFLNQLGTEVNSNTSAITGKQASDADLTAIAGLTPNNDDIIQRKAGAWTNRSPGQLKTDLVLTKGDVGLTNVDNVQQQPLDSTLTALAALTIAANKLIYGTGSDAFTTTDLTAFARSLLDDADAATARATLGLNNVTNNAQYYPGGTDVAIADGGTGVSTLPTGLLVGAGTGAITAKTAPTGAVVGDTDTQTLTNKRTTPRIGTVASSATPTASADSHDQYNVTALAEGATFGAPTGTPTDGQKLIYRVKDNGSARSLAFNAVFRAIGVTAPTTTAAGKTTYIGTIYNAADSKWDIIAVGQEA